MKVLNSFFATLMLLAGLLTGGSAFAQSTAPAANCSVLYSADAVEVGAVCVTVNPDAENVFLDYLLIDDWTLDEAHAWIGDNASNLPIDGSGNPQVSVFPHSASNLGGVSDHSFVIPFSELAINADTFCNADVVVAASAVVSRTVTGSGDGGGKSDKSGKSGKSGQSDKSGKSAQSDKSGKSSDNGKGSKGSKNSGKSGKGSSHNGSSSWGSSSGSSSSVTTSSWGKSGKSGDDGKSGQSSKSGKSGKSGSSGGGSTDPVTETVVAWAGSTAIGDGSYFTFSNDFCVDGPPVVELPQGCFNVFAGMPGSTPSFTPVGVTDNVIGYLNTFTTAVGGFTAPMFNGDGVNVGNALALLQGNGVMQVLIALDTGRKLNSINVYADAFGTFDNVSPLEYGTSVQGDAGLGFTVPVPLSSPAQLDLVIHAVICPPVPI